MKKISEKLLSPCDRNCSGGCNINCDELNLKSLELQATIGGISEIKPAFSPLITNYLVYVQSDIANISIAPAVSSAEESSITVNDSPVESGAANNYSLEVGNNVFEIVITSKANNSFNTYLLLVIREDIQPIIDKFQRLTYEDKDTGVILSYNIFVPDNYDPNVSYPLVLFLHGAGERGSDSLTILTENQGATIWAKEAEQAKRPCFVLAPQCPAKKGWISLMKNGWEDPFKPTDELGAAYNLLQKTIKEYNIDTTRLYSTGLSMGGFGSWALNIEYPDLFAALVPVCSGGDETQVNKLSQKPIWVFTAEEDPLVHVEYVQKTVDALKNAGGTPRYTEYPIGTYFYPMAHFSWVPAYANEEMREWMFSQRLG